LARDIEAKLSIIKAGHVHHRLSQLGIHIDIVAHVGGFGPLVGALAVPFGRSGGRLAKELERLKVHHDLLFQFKDFLVGKVLIHRFNLRDSVLGVHLHKLMLVPGRPNHIVKSLVKGVQSFILVDCQALVDSLLMRLVPTSLAQARRLPPLIVLFFERFSKQLGIGILIGRGSHHGANVRAAPDKSV